MSIVKAAAVFFILGSMLLVGCQTGPSTAAKAQPASDVHLPAIFTDNMVLQRGAKVPVWGWASPGGRVTVAIGKQKASAVAGKDGQWKTKLRSMPAGGPYQMMVSGKDTITLSNVMVGEVWVCSGQSNMQWWVKFEKFGVQNAEQEVAAANYPNIRLFAVPMVTSFSPKDNLEKSEGWKVCSPETVPPFSAVGYFFGREIHKHLNVPVGMIQSAWGGTVAEAWTSRASLETLPDFKTKLEQMDEELPHLPELQKEYETKLAEWNGALDSHDAGYTNGQPAWADPAADTAGWTAMLIPTYWEDAGFPGFDGFMWLRKDVDVPASWAGKELALCLGPINDADRTWFNETLVGSLEPGKDWKTPRVYAIPAGIAEPGRNVITVRAYDIGGKGGICGTATDLKLGVAGAQETETIPLAGQWVCKPGLDLKSAPAKPQPPLLAEKNPNVPTVLYNAMIAPLVPYGIRGAIWYQGESNATRAYQYRALFPTLIRDWRKNWDRGDFPFLYVQLANWMQVKPEPADDAWAELREAQLMTLSVPKTGMAVTIDIGEADDIHPKNKQDVGKRLALAAQRVAYHEKLVYSGPIYTSMRVEGNAIRLRFARVGGGLMAKDGGKLTGFAIAGEDRKFVWADARIEGNSVVVSGDRAPKPVAVRYAWAINPICNLCNREGLPASPFRTDTWPGITVDAK